MFSVLYPEDSADDTDESNDENDQGDLHDEAAVVVSYSREALVFLSHSPPGNEAQLSRQCGLSTCSQRGQLLKCAGCAAIRYCAVAHRTRIDVEVFTFQFQDGFRLTFQFAAYCVYRAPLVS